MKLTTWFRHDSNARNDERMLALRAHFGWEGYGIFWGLIEMMRESSDGGIPNDLAVIKMGLNISSTHAEEVLEQVLNRCSDIGLTVFSDDRKRVFSPRLRREIEDYNDTRKKRVEAGKKSAALRGYGKSTRVKQVLNKRSANTRQDNTYNNKNTPAPNLVLGEFQNVTLSQGEFDKLKAKWNASGLASRIEILSAAKAAKPDKLRYKSDYAAMLNWERSGWFQSKNPQPPTVDHKRKYQEHKERMREIYDTDTSNAADIVNRFKTKQEAK